MTFLPKKGLKHSYHTTLLKQPFGKVELDSTPQTESQTTADTAAKCFDMAETKT